VILGAPGAGKGTQARKLSRKHGWPHVSTGDIFRSHIENDTEIGQKIEKSMNRGRLVPDSLTCSIMDQRLGEDDCRNGYILDGFPRSVPQAEALENMLEERGERLDAVILIEVDDEEIVERLTARRVCPQCGKIFNLKYEPPTPGKHCSRTECREELVQREDDHEETIRERLRVYHETTEPLIAFYNERGLVRRVGGPDRSPEDVAQEIETILSGEGVRER
jgi:adenylate kinase